MLLETRRRTYVWEKAKKDFAVFLKISLFFEKKIFAKYRERKQNKNNVCERSEDGLSSHTFIFISMFLTKMDLF